MRIEGCGALVTGGGSGLGEATARELAKRGARVTILDLGRSRGAEIASDIGSDARFVEADVTSEEQVGEAVEQALHDFGPLRILINCAGIGGAKKTTSRGEAHPLDHFQRIITVNLIGTFNCIRLAATEMAGQEPLADGERGVIVNTASVAAFDGQIGQAAYAASKGGIVGMTLPIARDLAASGVRVNTIAPGLFDTPLLHGLPDDVKAALGASVPFPSRFGTPEEYASLARHICENVMLNAETIRLDGAIRMAPK